MLKKIVMCTAALVLSSSIYTMAETKTPDNIKLEGNSEGIVFIPGDEPFLLKEGMMPGDTVSRKMIIDNEYDVEYEVFMRAERVSEKEEYDLLNKLELTVYYNDEVIYNGPASGEDELSNNISLGKFKPGEEADLYAEVTLDGPTTGNEYKNKYAQVDWIFTAVNEGKETTPTNPSKPSVNKPTTTDKNPYTGDSSVFTYVIVGLIGIVILLGSNVKRVIKRGDR